MNKIDAREILTEAFLRLTPKQLGNLAWHEAKKTPICCGDDACLFADGSGGG